MNVSAKWPGSTHDSHIWNNSVVKNLMTSLHDRGYSSYFLLGNYLINLYWVMYNMNLLVVLLRTLILEVKPKFSKKLMNPEPSQGFN